MPQFPKEINFNFLQFFSLSRTNSLVPCEFEIERVHCISIFDFKQVNAAGNVAKNHLIFSHLLWFKLIRRHLIKENFVKYNGNINAVPDQMSIDDYSHCSLCMTSLGRGPVRRIDSSGHLTKISC